jgi:hypothetical protein
LSRPDSHIVFKLAGLDASQRRAVLKAIRLLVVARWQHLTRPIKVILTDFEQVADKKPADPDETELIGWAIAAVAARVPWRSDCLLQAMAAARWLNDLDRCHSLSIGVRKSTTGLLEAHAWLKSGDTIVTGNVPDLAGFQPISSISAEADNFSFN